MGASARARAGKRVRTSRAASSKVEAQLVQSPSSGRHQGLFARIRSSTSGGRPRAGVASPSRLRRQNAHVPDMAAYYNVRAPEKPKHSMKTRPLGRTALQVSEIGFGAWGLSGAQWIGATESESLKAL